MAKAREYTEAAVAVEQDYVQELKYANHSGPTIGVTLDVSSVGLSWNQSRSELILNVPAAPFDDSIRDRLDQLVVDSFPGADERQRNRYNDDLLGVLYNMQVEHAVLALLKK